MRPAKGICNIPRKCTGDLPCSLSAICCRFLVCSPVRSVSRLCICTPYTNIDCTIFFCLNSLSSTPLDPLVTISPAMRLVHPALPLLHPALIATCIAATQYTCRSSLLITNPRKSIGDGRLPSCPIHQFHSAPCPSGSVPGSIPLSPSVPPHLFISPCAASRPSRPSAAVHAAVHHHCRCYFNYSIISCAVVGLLPVPM